ncbi:hypothetical protein DITRI_Ditri07aG0155900 [Diplodiscus trichospermus]
MAGSSGVNKDKRHRSKWDILKLQVGVLRNLEKKIDLVEKAMGKLKDPLFSLKQLEPLMHQNKCSAHIQTAESALKELQSFFQQSKHAVQNLDCADEIQEFPPGSIEDLQITDLAKKFQEAKEELRNKEVELKKLNAMLDKIRQSLEKAKVSFTASSMLCNEVNFWSDVVAKGILNQDSDNQIQGHHGVEIKSKHLAISLPQIPGSIQINQKGKNAEIHNQEMDPLAINGDDNLNFDSPFSLAWDNDMMALSPDETCIVQGYKVSRGNADLLIEIFQKHFDVAENFEVADPDLQSIYMNLLVEVHRKIMKAQMELVEPEYLEEMKKHVGCMEYIGLKVAWLKEMLEIKKEEMTLQKRFQSLQNKKLRLFSG